MSTTNMVRAGMLTASLLLYAGHRGAAAELVPPPDNSGEILQHHLQQQVEARLRQEITNAKREFDREVLRLGKLFYDKLLTKGSGSGSDSKEVLEHLVGEVFQRSGDRRNPEINYQEDLRAVVEAATDDLLRSHGQEVGSLREHVRRIVIRDLLEAVGITGMNEVAHMVSRSNIEGVLKTAHEKARQRLGQEIEDANRQGQPIRDSNARWKQILSEEYTKAATDWVLQRLSENWGVDPARLGHDRDKKSQLEDTVNARVRQITENETRLADLISFIRDEVQEIFAVAGDSGKTDDDLKRELLALLTKFRDTLGEQMSAEEEERLVAEVARQSQRRSPLQPTPSRSQPAVGSAKPSVAPGGNVPAKTGGPPGPKPKPLNGEGSDEPPPADLPDVGIAGLLPGVPVLFRQTPHHFWFLIELRMRSQESSDVIVAIHQIKQPTQGSVESPADEIERENLMPPNSFAVGGFNIREIEKAAKAIQNVLEGVNGVNLCIDEAMVNALRASGSGRTPHVQLNLRVAMRDQVFGPVWKDAVRMSVESVARNEWAGVTIRFHDPTEASE